MSVADGVNLCDTSVDYVPVCGGGVGGYVVQSGYAASAYSGGGGGGAGCRQTDNKAGGDGGSGIVIIAYKGPQRGEGGTIDQTSRPGYTIHKFTDAGTDRFIG